jgi:hypothetical protein
VVAVGEQSSRSRQGDGLPILDRRRLGQLSPLLAGTFVECLPLLAGPWPRRRRSLFRDHRRYVGDLLGYRVRGSVDVFLGGGCSRRFTGEAAAVTILFTELPRILQCHFHARYRAGDALLASIGAPPL